MERFETPSASCRVQPLQLNLRWSSPRAAKTEEWATNTHEAFSTRPLFEDNRGLIKHLELRVLDKDVAIDYLTQQNNELRERVTAAHDLNFQLKTQLEGRTVCQTERHSNTYQIVAAKYEAKLKKLQEQTEVRAQALTDQNQELAAEVNQLRQALLHSTEQCTEDSSLQAQLASAKRTVQVRH